jgi:uncharacterized cupredoxin-like copper-binding protein
MFATNTVRALLLAAPVIALAVAPALAATPTVIKVKLDNTGNMQMLTLAPVTVPAGKVEFDVANASVDAEHEMIVVKTPLAPDQLPTNADRSRVDEDKFPGAEEVSELKPGTAGKLEATLAAGHYVLFCNIKNHFKDGMYAELTVTP